MKSPENKTRAWCEKWRPDLSHAGACNRACGQIPVLQLEEAERDAKEARLEAKKAIAEARREAADALAR